MQEVQRRKVETIYQMQGVIFQIFSYFSNVLSLYYV